MSFHPAFYVAARVHARKALRAKGVGFLASIEQAQDVTSDVVDAAVSATNAAVPGVLTLAPAGTSAGPLVDILTAIEQFFTSGVGQQILAAILKLIGA